MSIQTQPMQNLVEKIQSLPADRIAEVEDFVDFLKQRTQTRQPSPRKPLDFPVISVGKWCYFPIYTHPFALISTKLPSQTEFSVITVMW